ncbi:MAG: 1-deoxy-D-xylulose-5-phosphate reductoisomerase [Lentisphaeria bacterium]|nr:1-deoxy-D-xylulose-5-phosphate reductoisomerase [Lentisphaeria bacterium]
MDPQRKNVVILGASGSVGSSAVRVIRAAREKFRITAMSGYSRMEELAALCREFECPCAVAADPARYEELKGLLPGTRCLSGIEGMAEAAAAPETDILLCAVAGADGLLPVIAALKAGKKVAIASKEVLVLAGELVMKLARPGQLLPVDSEHAGVWQCLERCGEKEVKKIIITASGGPFRLWEKEKILNATVEEALRHPTWNMGKKITIDSASMMNKALELVEANRLFRVTADQLGVIVHPQSKVHAMVELTDGSLLAQIAVPDMRLPTAWALTYPERGAFDFPPYDWVKGGTMEFFEPDTEKFPSFGFADAAMRTGGTLPGVMSAANDIAVERFLRREIPFGGIWKIIGKVMEEHKVLHNSTLEEILAVDRESRIKAHEVKL